MILKSPIDAVAFSDGIVYICRRERGGALSADRRKYYYSETGYSYKRLFEAEQEQQAFERIIRIPCPTDADVCRGMAAVIGKSKYIILTAKRIMQTSPVCMELTLGNWSMAMTIQRGAD